MRLSGNCCFFSHYIYPQDRMIRQDIKILKELGFSVSVATRFRQIPWNCDLYFSWWASGSILPFIKAFLSGKPIITVAGGSEAICVSDSIINIPFGYLAYPWYKRLATQICLRYSDVILPVSHFMLKESIRLPMGNPIVIYNGVDTEAFILSAKKKEYVVAIFHFQKNIFKIKHR